MDYESDVLVEEKPSSMNPFTNQSHIPKRKLQTGSSGSSSTSSPDQTRRSKRIKNQQNSKMNSSETIEVQKTQTTNKTSNNNDISTSIYDHMTDDELLDSIIGTLSPEIQSFLSGSSGLIMKQVVYKMADKIVERRMKKERQTLQDELLALKFQQEENSKITPSKSSSQSKHKSSQQQLHVIATPPKQCKELKIRQDSAGTSSHSEQILSNKSNDTNRTGQATTKEESLLQREKKEKERLERERKKEEERLERERKKEEERLERERKKEEERLERERKKEEEKRKKEEERLERERKKEEERIEREQKREREKAEREKKKEEERLKREEQKRKEAEFKEKQQSTISNFFIVNKKSEPPFSQVSNQSDVKTKSTEDQTSDFDKFFLPYYKRADVEIYLPTAARLEHGNAQPEDQNIIDWFKSQRCERGYDLKYTANDVLNIANDEKSTEKDIFDALLTLPFKHLQFEENVRPPYQGTFSRSIPGGVPRANPFFTEGSSLNYNYDSDLEWSPEDEEGEDLDNDDDESDDATMDEEEEDMDDFLSSDENEGTNRRRILGPLKPFISWNDGEQDQDLYKSMELDILLRNEEVDSIDPFHDYWTVPTEKKKKSTPGQTKLRIASGSLQTEDSKKLIKEEDMKSFLLTIQGAEVNQTFLVETLKIDFPQYSKEAIRATLKEVASRVGEKEPNKRWTVDQKVWSLYFDTT